MALFSLKIPPIIVVTGTDTGTLTSNMPRGLDPNVMNYRKIDCRMVGHHAHVVL
jgi:hypothetical protein